jgi:hypothetical protein
MKMTTLKKAKPTRYSAGPERYSPVSAQGRQRRRLQTHRGTGMASARRGESTTDDAMAAEMNRQSSGHRDSSDYDGEAADYSPSLRKKEMLEGKYDDDDDDDGAFSQTESEGPPELDLSSFGDDIQDHQESRLPRFYQRIRRTVRIRW